MIECNSSSEPKWIWRSNLSAIDKEITEHTTLHPSESLYVLHVTPINRNESGIYECVGFTENMVKFHSATKVKVICKWLDNFQLLNFLTVYKMIFLGSSTCLNNLMKGNFENVSYNISLFILLQDGGKLDLLFSCL